MILLSILYALLGISILIFVHELGHFLAAKRVGVRVERFAIGFDPPIRGRNLRLLSFRKGDTEYVLGAIPFGGYVKMAGGELMFDSSHKAAPDELPGKSVGARALVFVAGSVMNIAFAFIFFMVAFAIGVPFPEPIVGGASPGSPAWKAGVLPQDRILKIDGRDVMDFSEVRMAVALGSSSTPMDLVISRAEEQGMRVERELSMTPRWEPELGFSVLGLRPASSDQVAKPPVPDSLAARAGMTQGDRIVAIEIAGRRVPTRGTDSLVTALEGLRVARPSSPYRLVVERGGKELSLAMEPRKAAGKKPLAALGIDGSLSGGTFVRDVHPASAAMQVFHPGDRITRLEGEAISVLRWIDVHEKLGERELVSLEIEDQAGAVRTAQVSPTRLVEWILGGQVQWDEPRCRAGTLAPQSTLAQSGLAEGDLLTHADGQVIYGPEDLVDVLGRRSTASVEIVLLRAGKKVPLSLPRSQLLEARGLEWISVQSLKGVSQGSPAERAGITPGSRIVRIADRPIRAWQDIPQELERQGAGSKVQVTWIEAGGQEKTAQITAELEQYESFLDGSVEFEPLQKIHQLSVVEAFSAGARRTVLTGQQIFLTLRSLVRRDVSPKNLSGPLGITHLLTVVAGQDSFGLLIYWLALISVNLGLFNLLPFPILDGGHLLFLAIEKVKGSPVSVKVQEWAMNVALLAIVFLALFVTFNDLKRLLP